MIRKILLVIEDYHERTYLQTMLKKIGWDVIGLSTELGISEQLLTFAPEVVILSQMMRRTKGQEIAHLIKKRDGYPKILMIGLKSPNREELEAAGIDLFLTSPVNNRMLFEFLEKAGGFSAKASLQKIRNMKYPLEKGMDGSVKVLKSNGEQQLIPVLESAFDEVKVDRQQRYEEFLAKVETPPIQKHFQTDEIKERIESIQGEGYSSEDKKLDEEKRGFVKALFGASKKKP